MFAAGIAMVSVGGLQVGDVLRVRGGREDREGPVGVHGDMARLVRMGMRALKVVDMFDNLGTGYPGR